MLEEKEYLDKIIQGHVLEVLKEIPSEVVDTAVTSPPYYSLRFYKGANVVWGGDPECDHEWEFYTRPSNCWSKPGRGLYGVKGEYNKAWIKEHQQAFCKKCGAWWGQLGLEPHPQMYIDHLVQIFREVKRVLKKTGVFFLNIGDTYWGSLQGFGMKRKTKKTGFQNVLEQDQYPGHYFMPPTGSKDITSKWLQPKQKLMIPSRVAIALQEDGWILRNTIIWHKPNHMPHPVKDRLTNAYESIFFFVKNKKYFFNLDAIREPHIWASKDKRSLLRRVPHKSGKSLTGQYASNAVGYHPLGKNPGNVWRIKTSSFKGGHFAVFPEELVRKCLIAGCPENGVVLDPFIGSGTTAVIAKSLGLHYIGIEIVPKYVEMARNRIKGKLDYYL